MALIPRAKGSLAASRKIDPAARRVELKNPANRAAMNKKLRRAAVRQRGKSFFPAVRWLKIPALLGWCLGIGLGLFIFFFMGVGLLYAYNYFTTNPYFEVKTIEIEGHNRLKSREVLEIAGLDYGQNTLAISIDDIESALARNPWIAELSVRRVLPDGIRIKIREYEPWYWVKRDDGQMIYADEYGTPIAAVSTGDSFSSYPLLKVEEGAEYLAARLPGLIGSLERMNFPVNVRGAGSISLTAARGLNIALGSGLRLVIGLDGWDANVKNLLRVLEDLSRRGELKGAAEIKAWGSGVWVTGKKTAVLGESSSLSAFLAQVGSRYFLEGVNG